MLTRRERCIGCRESARGGLVNQMLIDRLLANLSVRVEPFALCQLSSGWRMHLPGPTAVTLHYVLKGSGVIRGPDGRSHPISRSGLVIVPPLAVHVLEAGSTIRDELRIATLRAGSPLQTITAGPAATFDLLIACGVIDARYGRSFGLFDRLRELLVVDLSGIPQVETAFEGIFTEQSRVAAGSDTMTGALMTQCLVHMFRRLLNEGRRAVPWLIALTDRRLARAIDLILDDPAAEHSVESLAEIASMSRSTFAEHFTTACGHSPMSFVHHIRMQRAVELLEIEGLSVDQVSKRVGFASRSHFSRAFKRHTGTSPLPFRHAGLR